MINRHHLPLAVYYEHPEWFRPLFAELDRRSIQYVRIDAGCHGYNPTAADRNYALLVNRMSASAYLRGNVQGIFFTRDYLAYLERIGTRVINGCKAFSFEISKAAQLALLHSLGLATPRSRIVNCAIEAISAAEEIGFPVIIKPNIGGRGAGIIRLDSAPELAHATAPIISCGGVKASTFNPVFGLSARPARPRPAQSVLELMAPCSRRRLLLPSCISQPGRG